MEGKNMLKVENLTKTFKKINAVENVSFEVNAGEIIGLLGENGAGKSTLMNMLAGLLQPTSGQILVKGEEARLDSPSKSAKMGIGMVHQHFMLVEAFTVAENIILGNEVTKRSGNS